MNSVHTILGHRETRFHLVYFNTSSLSFFIYLFTSLFRNFYSFMFSLSNFIFIIFQLLGFEKRKKIAEK
jgi:hypothetical protein